MLSHLSIFTTVFLEKASVTSNMNETTDPKWVPPLSTHFMPPTLHCFLSSDRTNLRPHPLSKNTHLATQWCPNALLLDINSNINTQCPSAAPPNPASSDDSSGSRNLSPTAVLLPSIFLLWKALPTKFTCDHPIQIVCYSGSTVSSVISRSDLISVTSLLSPLWWHLPQDALWYS